MPIRALMSTGISQKEIRDSADLRPSNASAGAAMTSSIRDVMPACVSSFSEGFSLPDGSGEGTWDEVEASMVGAGESMGRIDQSKGPGVRRDARLRACTVASSARHVKQTGTGRTPYLLKTSFIPSLSMVKVDPSTLPTVFPAPFQVMLRRLPSSV